MQPRSPRRLPLVASFILVTTIVVGVGWARAEAATITASYAAGYRNVTINGYGATGMGTFTLRDGGDDQLALCIEADAGHSTVSDAYAPADNRVQSAELDALLWWLDRQPNVDDDTAIAAAALAWYYARATRTIGPLVWSDGHRDFAAIGPLSPEPWDALPQFTTSHMIGLVASGNHLDAAERRVAELHRLATRLAGPWKLEADPDGRTFTLMGRNGPIAGQPVSITIEPSADEPTSHTVTTDADGTATVDLPRLSDGAMVRATATAPGVHAEWGGSGIQRMATPTPTSIDASFTVEPLPRHVRVVKRSTDATIGVAGARFEVRDRSADVVGTATTDASGRADFAPIDPVAAQPPFEIIEVAAPPGLVIDPTPHRVDDASTRAADPTVVEVVNRPATVEVSVRKELTIPDVGPDDLSGFRFIATRREDDAEHHLETRRDGTTGPISVPIGTYDVCERSVPDWAANLIDGGCVELVVDAGAVATATPIVLDYVNGVPAPTIETHASDRDDGDRTMSASGGAVVDRVELTGLVPGTTYTVIGEAVGLGDEPVATGVTAEHTFVATSPEEEIDLTFSLPAGESGAVVIVERLMVADRVVAVHDDLDDADQTIILVAPPTTTTSTTTTTTTTTAPSTTTTTSTSTSTPPTSTPPTSSTPTTVLPTTVLPTTVPPTTPTPSTLPRTGSDATETLLRLGDIGFVVGVGLVVLAGLGPRRRTRA